MDSIGVVVGNIIPNQAAQMRLTKRDDVIKQLSAAAVNPVLCGSILPGVCRVCGFTMIKALLHAG